jgi:predicted nucleic acid-binding protein
MTIVSDSGPITSFARAGRLDLLRQVVNELIIPDAVHEEIAVSGHGKPGAEEVRQGKWIKPRKLQNRSLGDTTPRLLLRLAESTLLQLGQTILCLARAFRLVTAP